MPASLVYSAQFWAKRPQTKGRVPCTDTPGYPPTSTNAPLEFSLAPTHGEREGEKEKEIHKIE